MTAKQIGNALSQQGSPGHPGGHRQCIAQETATAAPGSRLRLGIAGRIASRRIARLRRRGILWLRRILRLRGTLRRRTGSAPAWATAARHRPTAEQSSHLAQKAAFVGRGGLRLGGSLGCCQLLLQIRNLFLRLSILLLGLFERQFQQITPCTRS